MVKKLIVTISTLVLMLLTSVGVALAQTSPSPTGSPVGSPTASPTASPRPTDDTRIVVPGGAPATGHAGY